MLVTPFLFCFFSLFPLTLPLIYLLDSTLELKMGDIGVRVGWGVVSWLYAARDTVAACSHNSTIWHNDGHNNGHNEME